MGREGWGAQNFALFFPSPVPISFFLSLSGCLLVEFWWCLKRRGAQMCTFGVLRLSCEAPAAPPFEPARCVARPYLTPKNLGQWGCSLGQFVAHVLFFGAIPAPDPPLCCVVLCCVLVWCVFMIFVGAWAAEASHDDTENSKRVHFRVPEFKNTTKIQREDTQRGKKRTNFAAGEGKKSKILGGPGEGRSREGWSKPNLETNTHK